MNWLCYLYPRSWRRRYAQELAALLEARGLSLNDVMDTALGTIDAHLNPQPSLSDHETAPETPSSHRSANMSQAPRDSSMSGRMAAIGLILVVPILLFAVVNISAYSLGVTFLRDSMDLILSDANTFRVFNAVSPFVFIGGPLLALSIIPILRVDLRADSGQLIGTVVRSTAAPSISLSPPQASWRWQF